MSSGRTARFAFDCDDAAEGARSAAAMRAPAARRVCVMVVAVRAEEVRRFYCGDGSVSTFRHRELGSRLGGRGCVNGATEAPGHRVQLDGAAPFPPASNCLGASG